jgi:hypothetical protein
VLWRARHGGTCGGGRGGGSGSPRRPVAGFMFSARKADGVVIIGTAAGSHQRHPDPRIPAPGNHGPASSLTGMRDPPRMPRRWPYRCRISPAAARNSRAPHTRNRHRS